MTWPDGPGAGQILLEGSVKAPPAASRHYEQLALVDLLDRVLAGGVVIAGEVTLSIAGVDLVVISLRALIASAAALAGVPAGSEEPGDDRD